MLPRRLALPLAASVALTVIGLAGCGGGGDGARENRGPEGVRAVVREFTAAFKNSKFADACDLLTPEAKTKLSSGSNRRNQASDCPGLLALGRAFAGKSYFERLEERIDRLRVRVNGNVATSDPLDPDDAEARYRYIDGKWFIDAEQPANERVKVEVTDQGFTQRSDKLLYGFVLTNRTGDADAVDVKATINAVDAGGNVLDTETERVSAIPRGASFNVGGDDIEVQSGQRAARLEISIDVDEAATTPRRLPEVSNVSLERQQFGGLKIRAQVNNSLSDELSSITDVFAVLRDAQGKIVGGASGFPEGDIPAGGRAAVEISSLEDLPAARSADVSVDAETG